MQVVMLLDLAMESVRLQMLVYLGVVISVVCELRIKLWMEGRPTRYYGTAVWCKGVWCGMVWWGWCVWPSVWCVGLSVQCVETGVRCAGPGVRCRGVVQCSGVGFDVWWWWWWCGLLWFCVVCYVRERVEDIGCGDYTVGVVIWSRGNINLY